MPKVDENRIRLFEDNSREILLVHLGLSYNICNFRCHYCYLPNWNKKIDPELSNKLERLLQRLTHIKRPLYIIFASDGEISVTPTLWPHLKKLLELNDLKMVTLFTNLSNNFEILLDIFPASKMAIIATYHIHQFRNVDIQRSRFFQRVVKLKKEAASIVVSFVLSPDQLVYYDEFKNSMEEIGVLSYAYPLLSKYTGKVDVASYTNEEIIKVKKILELDDNPAKIINDFLFGWRIKGLKCSAGSNYIEVSPEGQVYRCFAVCNDDYGNLFDANGPLINLRAEVCPLGGCSCNWAVAFTDEVSQKFKRINSLYHFVARNPDDMGKESLEVVNNR